MKNLFYLLFVMPLLFSCGGSEEESKKDVEKILKFTTVSMGNYRMHFKEDGVLFMYEANGSIQSNTADGKWSVEGDKVKIVVTNNHRNGEIWRRVDGKTFVYKNQYLTSQGPDGPKETSWYNKYE